MSHRQHEPVPVWPDGIVRIEPHDPLPETVGDGSHGHRGSRVAGVGLLYGIHRKGADRIDAGLVELGVRHRHHGPLCRGVILKNCRQ